MAGPDDYQMTDMDRELIAGEDELICPRCKGTDDKEVTLAIMCTAHRDGMSSWPCGCEGTEYMGMCKCDILVCPECGYIPMDAGKNTPHVVLG